MNYNQWKNYKLKFPFAGCEKLTSTYSQAFQDIFILSLLQGEKNGTYLEIGANVPVYTNNTYLLSSEFNWTGISIDFISALTEQWDEIRKKDKFYCADALAINYEELLDSYYTSHTIDYLQLDIDPCINTLSVLKKIPFDKYKFKIITFETDIYSGGISDAVRQESRKILLEHGYTLLADDVKVWWENSYCPYEDWYIDSNLINNTLAEQVQQAAKDANSIPEKFLFERNL